MGPGKVGLLSFFIGRGKVAPPSIRMLLLLRLGAGSGFGRHGRSLTGLRRGKVANLSAVAFVSRAAAAFSMEVKPPPPLIEVDVTGELCFGRRPKVANRSSVLFGGVVGFVGVTGLLVRMTDGCLPEARNDLAAGEVLNRMLLLRLGVMGLSGVFAFRLDG